jgi:hypothetical protein
LTTLYAPRTPATGKAFSLDQHGFAYCEDAEGATSEILNVLRENDKEKIRQVYYPHIESLVKRGTGTSHVVIFDQTTRKQRPELRTYENSTGKEQPATPGLMCDLLHLLPMD